MYDAYVSFFQEVQQPQANALVRILNDVMKNRPKSLCLLMSTTGGSIDLGFLLYNILRSLPTQLVVHNVGNVNSIGNVMFLAGEKRVANTNATFLFHGAFWPVMQGALDLKTIREIQHGLEIAHGRMSAEIAARTTLPKDEIDKLFLEQKVRDATYAKTHGFIQEIADFSLPNGKMIVHTPAA